MLRFSSYITTKKDKKWESTTGFLRCLKNESSQFVKKSALGSDFITTLLIVRHQSMSTILLVKLRELELVLERQYRWKSKFLLDRFVFIHRTVLLSFPFFFCPNVGRLNLFKSHRVTYIKPFSNLTWDYYCNFFKLVIHIEARLFINSTQQWPVATGFQINVGQYFPTEKWWSRSRQ